MEAEERVKAEKVKLIFVNTVLRRTIVIQIKIKKKMEESEPSPALSAGPWKPVSKSEAPEKSSRTY